MIQQIWRDLLTSKDLGERLAAQDDVEEVIVLMVKSRIDPRKFTGNLQALFTGGRPSITEFFGGDKALPTTPSISKFASVLDRPPNASLWLLAGFPDVLNWFNEKLKALLLDSSVDEEEEERVTAELFGIQSDSLLSADEGQFENADGRLRAKYYATLISNFTSQTGKALEVAVQEGSAGDIYLGTDLLQASGEESNFTLIATITTKYYLELKRTYRRCFPDETALLAMSGIVDANVYILDTQEITPAQIIELAKGTEGMQDRLLEFLVRFEVLVLSIDNQGVSPEEVRSACEDQRAAISASIQRVMDSYTAEPMFVNAVRAAMSSPQFAELRRMVGVRRDSIFGKVKAIIFG